MEGPPPQSFFSTADSFLDSMTLNRRTGKATRSHQFTSIGQKVNQKNFFKELAELLD